MKVIPLVIKRQTNKQTLNENTKFIKPTTTRIDQYPLLQPSKSFKDDFYKFFKEYKYDKELSPSDNIILMIRKYMDKYDMSSLDIELTNLKFADIEELNAPKPNEDEEGNPGIDENHETSTLDPVEAAIADLPVPEAPASEEDTCTLCSEENKALKAELEALKTKMSFMKDSAEKATFASKLKKQFVEGKNLVPNISYSVNGATYNISSDEPSEAVLSDSDLYLKDLSVKSIKPPIEAVIAFKENLNNVIDSLTAIDSDVEHKHYILEYDGDLLDELHIHCYELEKMDTCRLRAGLEPRFMPFYSKDEYTLWIPISFIGAPYINNVRVKPPIYNRMASYIDTVTGGYIRFGKRFNLDNYIEHHNEIKWIKKIEFKSGIVEIQIA